MPSIDINMAAVARLAKEVAGISKNALPYAVADTLDAVASTAKKETNTTTSRLFVLRNTWTRRTINYKKSVERRNLENMSSEIGSRAEYMAKQEAGFRTDKRGKVGVAIPTAYSAGQGHSAVRTKTVRRNYRLQHINLAKYKSKVHGPRQGLIVAVRTSMKANVRYMFLGSREGVRPGVYRLVGGRRVGRNRGWPKGGALEMLYDLSETSTTTKPHKWLAPATTKAISNMGVLFKFYLERQLRQRTSYR